MKPRFKSRFFAKSGLQWSYLPCTENSQGSRVYFSRSVNMNFCGGGRGGGGAVGREVFLVKISNGKTSIVY